MQYIVDLFTNKLFIAPISAWLIAQIIKIIIDSNLLLQFQRGSSLKS